FTAAGFTPLSDYYSALTTLDGPDPRLEELVASLAQQGITVRALEPASFDADLARLYDLVMVSFQHALLFAPISREEFMAQYTPLRTVLIPQLVLLAEQAGRLVGFLLA